MAYVASWIAPMGCRTGGVMSTGEPWNDRGFNEWNKRQETHGYFKPPFCKWPCGGFTRREAHYRCVNGEMCVAPGSSEYLARYDPKGMPLSYDKDITTLVHRDDHKDRPATSSTCNLMTNLMAPATFHVAKAPKYRPEPGQERFKRFDSMPELHKRRAGPQPVSPRTCLLAGHEAKMKKEAEMMAKTMTGGAEEFAMGSPAARRRSLIPPPRPQLAASQSIIGKRSGFRARLRGGDSLKACADRRMEMTGGNVGFPKVLKSEKGELLGPGRVPKKEDPDNSPVRRFLKERPLPSPAQYLGNSPGGRMKVAGSAALSNIGSPSRLRTGESWGSVPGTGQVAEPVLYFDPPESATPRTRTMDCFRKTGA